MTAMRYFQMTPRRSFTRLGIVLAVVALASGIVVGFGESLGSEKSAAGGKHAAAVRT